MKAGGLSGMQAIAVVPGTPGGRLVERPEPQLAAPDQVKLRVLQVGICGTDREEYAGGRALLPPGQNDLVIGHEMFGQVVEAGNAVRRVKAGDYAVFTVRRGCSKCLPCTMLRPDMCRTGDYRERGIWGLDGYQTRFVVDEERWAVRVAPELAPVGVLAEPTSVVEKAIDEAVRIQASRLPAAAATPAWLYGRRCLVAGLGPIGLLAAMILRLRGAEVYGLDILDPASARPQWLARIGGTYLDGRQVTATHLRDRAGAMELILEATGVPALGFNLLDALAPSGICALTGIPGGNRCLEIGGAEILRSMVLNNTLTFGSVNAARDHFQMGVDDLGLGLKTWPGHVEGLITHRHRYTDFAAALAHHAGDEVKAVIEWQ